MASMHGARRRKVDPFRIRTEPYVTLSITTIFIGNGNRGSVNIRYYRFRKRYDRHLRHVGEISSGSGSDRFPIARALAFDEAFSGGLPRCP
jgi:hypothetical protein